MSSALPLPDSPVPGFTSERFAICHQPFWQIRLRVNLPIHIDTPFLKLHDVTRGGDNTFD